MQQPDIPLEEPTRIDALRELELLDTLPEERFDRITRIAKRLFGVSIALISLVDDKRQWFKSKAGLDVDETPRDISFCGHAILGDESFVVTDTLEDSRFCDNPLVTEEPHIRFYAGYPLVVSGGSKIGTLCIIDSSPRAFTTEDEELLRDLASLAAQELIALQLATMDHLTKLSNRRGFETLSHHALELCRRMGTPAALIYFDLDDFKTINDEFGHLEGDSALANFAALLKIEFRGSDVIARFGGDEFAVMMLDSTEAGLDTALERFRHSVDAFNDEGLHRYKLEFSYGLVKVDTARHSGVASLVNEADQLMYQQKRSKRR